MMRARALLDEAAGHCDASSLGFGRTGVLAGLAWWFLAAGEPAQAIKAAAQAAAVASETQDPATQIVAGTARAAAQASAEPTGPNIEAFLTAAQQRAGGLTFGSLPFPDAPDVAALVERLTQTKLAPAGA
jgi:hypothetical protein